MIEDDDDEMEEQHNMSREEAVQKHEENKVLIGKEDYKVCARATLSISVAQSLEARYFSPGFPHISPVVFFFSWSPLSYLNPVLRTKSGITHDLVPIVGKL